MKNTQFNTDEPVQYMDSRRDEDTIQAEFLKQNPIFTEDCQSALTHTTSLKLLHKNDILFSQGSQAKSSFAVVSGTIQIRYQVSKSQLSEFPFFETYKKTLLNVFKKQEQQREFTLTFNRSTSAQKSPQPDHQLQLRQYQYLEAQDLITSTADEQKQRSEPTYIVIRVINAREVMRFDQVNKYTFSGVVASNEAEVMFIPLNLSRFLKRSKIAQISCENPLLFTGEGIREDLALAFERTFHSPGDSIYTQNEEVKFVYILEQGEVYLSKRSTTEFEGAGQHKISEQIQYSITTLGEMFGEQDIKNQMERNHTAKTVGTSTTKLLRINSFVRIKVKQFLTFHLIAFP